MKKRILSLMLAFAMTAGMVNAEMAAEEKNINVSSPLEMKYPAADITPEFVENNFSSQGNYILKSNPLGKSPSKKEVVLPADDDREFKLKLNNGNEKSYLLLDKDSAGNYFIVEKMPTMDTGWKYYKGSSDCAANLTSDNVWKFDITVSDSRAYYLNDFSNGYTVPSKNYFAPVLKDYLVEKDWSIGADSAKDYTGENSEWSSAKRANNQAYTTKGKIALLSAQEYITYLDVLGYIHSGDAGTALRTPASRFYKSGESTLYSCGPLKVYSTANNVSITYGAAPDSTKLNVQVCFWVNQDFFKEVKLEAAGADVVAEMQATVTIDELLEVYGIEGLSSILGINYKDSLLEMKYPTVDITPQFVEDNFSTQGNYILGSNPLGKLPNKKDVVLPMNNDRAFKLPTKDGTEKSFLLLDKDNKGNYFIVEKTPLDTTWQYFKSSSGWTADSTNENAWKFDTTVSSSRGYYLNDLTGGYTVADKNYFPPVLIDYLVEKDWSVGADSAIDYTEDNAEWSSAKRTNNPAYTTKGKLALLSAQEYITYLDILGYQHAGNAGTALRTPASRVYKSEGTTAYSCGPLVVKSTADDVIITYGNAPNSSDGLNIQVCFWVTPDFFKEVKLDISQTGQDVLDVIRDSYIPEDLAGTYSETEIAIIYGTAEPISNVQITSNDVSIEDISKVNSIKVSADFADFNADKVMIAAVYDGGRLLNVGIANTSEQLGLRKTVEVSGFSGASKCSFFVWDSFDRMVPEFKMEWVSEFNVGITGIYDPSGKNQLLIPDDIVELDEISVKIDYDNRNEAGKSLDCYIQFFDSEGNSIKNASEAIQISAFHKSYVPVIFQIPEESENVSAIKITLFDSNTSQSVGESYFICDYDWKASGDLSDESAYNLVTTFYEDEGTTRAFAWTADTEHTDMAIRYADADDEWYGESTVKDASYVEYDGRLYYKVVVEGLTPGENYVYKIGDKQDDLWSEKYSFTTEPDDLIEFSFLGVTDPQSETQKSFGWYKSILDAAFDEDSDIDFMVNLGDMVEEGTEREQWDFYFEAVKGRAESIPHMAVVGNHETRGDADTAAKYYSLLFNNPQNGSDALGGLSVEDVSHKCTKGVINNFEGSVYSFDYGNAHFAVLNSGTDWSKDDTIEILTKQARWLEDDLDASDKKWKIVMIHQGMYPAKTERERTREPLLDVVDKCGVDLVLQGHDHMVARTYPMRANEIVSTQSQDSVTKGIGTVYTILGVAGPKRYADVTEMPEYMTVLTNTVKEQPTYSLFTVNDKKISVITKQLDGTVVDSFEITDSQ